jgi:TRAP transporter TAXI family solute receptor
MRFGGSGYVACFTLADLINKHSSWLRATCMETEGTIQNLRLLAEEPERRKRSLIYASMGANYMATQALPPFKKPYTGARAVSLSQWVAHSYVTLDPNIKTGRDFKGKRIGLPSKGSSGRLEPEILFKYAWDIMDKVKIDYLGWTPSINALRDGMVDVSIANPIFVGEDKVAPNPALEELMASRANYHFISISKEDINTARKKSGYPIYPGQLPSGALGPKQPKPLGIAQLTNGWVAPAELSDDVVYEICRIIYEYHKEFWSRHASLKGLRPEAMPKLAPEEKSFHPGAVKFYKDKGIKIGFPSGG